MDDKIIKKRLLHVRNKLLDLGKRNKMIHYRETTRSTLRLTEPSLEELYKSIVTKGQILTFKRPIDRDTDFRMYSMLSLLECMSSPLEVLIGDIRTSKPSYVECLRTLRNMRAKARLAIEEQGTNVLYICFGFIEWKEGKGSSLQTVRSPLVLVPAVLSIDGLNSPYKLSRHEDEIILNPTLEYYLKNEYGIELPAFDADKVTVEEYLGRLEEIADSRGWRILREVSLGLLSFQKITMYNDLMQNEDRILKNPVARIILGDRDISVSDAEGDEGGPDSVPVKECYQVLSADSSQQEAIILSKKNQSFVMQGPPGTGKSQTITNIIAEGLADGKRILFVSEKMAALRVVYKRLEEAHLADFCLPLHSYKANKKQIIEQLGENLNGARTMHVKEGAMAELDRLSELREELNAYASELHRPVSAQGISCYDAFGRLGELDGIPSVAASIENAFDISASELQKMLSAVEDYGLAARRLDLCEGKNPWEGFFPHIFGFELKARLKRELDLLCFELSAVKESLLSVPHCNSLPSAVSYEEAYELAELISAIGSSRPLPFKPDADFDFEHSLRLAREARKSKPLSANGGEDILRIYSESIFERPYNVWREELERAVGGIMRTGISDEESAEYYFDLYDEQRSALGELKLALEEIESAFEEMSDLLGVSISPSVVSSKRLSELYRIICKNHVMQKRWLAGDTSRLSSIAADASDNAAMINDIDEELLERWRAGVFSLDYDELLFRYENEYTSPFAKMINSQYHKDRRMLQELLKSGARGIGDAEIVRMLELLRLRSEKETWFSENSIALHELFPGLYKGIDSDWSYITSAAATAESIMRFPLGFISEDFKEVLCADHSREADVMKALLSRISEGFASARQIIRKNGFSLDLSSASFNASRSSAQIVIYLGKLEIIKNRISLIKKHLASDCVDIGLAISSLGRIDSYLEEKRHMKETEAEYRAAFGSLYAGCETDWDEIIPIFEDAARISSSPYYDLVAGAMAASPAEKRRMKRLSQSIISGLERSGESLDWLMSCFEGGKRSFDVDLFALYDRISACRDSAERLDDVIDYCEARRSCEQLGLSSFIKRADELGIPDNIGKIFLKCFWHSWLGLFNDGSAPIRKFRRSKRDASIKQFVKLDSKQLAIAQMRIRERLTEALPTPKGSLKATDEIGVLIKELAKKRNIMPLRKLFGRIPNLIMKLKPCLMMSPLSVSYFLEADAYRFDMVIFDEASQIFPEDAIGAIFRGSQVIIAGDSKQLPPTNFFAASSASLDGDFDLDEDELSDDFVSDSILEEAASVLPNRTLLWHYRSKHESLIAFSNREIYKNSLITFPASKSTAPDMGVEYVFVEDGVYEGGGKNCNIAEAEKCVELIRDHIERYPSRSLGIIAFSEKQQEAIENAVIEFREASPELEWFFDEGREEPFFVKNLENVQGDERDTVIFSICYARDASGRMYMRFGPLGHAGGERRLNVAITRAKLNVKLVGSILPSDIDLGRTDSEGVRMLRSYIEFARRGYLGASYERMSRDRLPEDVFCSVVADFLTEKGFKIKRSVGYSDYRIDIAVEDPKHPGEYLAGIECDGCSYVSAKTARDRDHIRKKVLESMGWRIYRVWSTEWMRDPDGEKRALLDFMSSDGGGSMIGIDGEDEPIDLSDIVEEPPKEEENEDPYGFVPYEQTVREGEPLVISNENRSAVAEELIRIISTEQPVHLDLIGVRMAVFSGKRLTNQTSGLIREVLENELGGRIWRDRDGFVRLLPLSPIRVRIPNGKTRARRMDHVCAEEAALAMLRIAEAAERITLDALYTECARAFGNERIIASVRGRLDEGFAYLERNGMASVEKGVVSVKKKN